MTLSPPPPIPLVAPTQWMTAAEVDTFRVAAAVPPPPPPIPLAHTCTWCAPGEAGPCVCRPAPPPPPIPLARPVYIMDTECYRDYWSIGFMDATTLAVTEFEFYPGTRLDVADVSRMMNAGTIVSFNGRKYDDPMIALALTGADNKQLKYASDAIIQTNLQPWLFESQFNVVIPKWDCIDLIDVAPGMANLKIYGGRLESKRMQDLPIEPSASISPDQRELLRRYRNNDLFTTLDLYRKLREQLDLRAAMSREYGVDLRSKSDAQIAEAVIKSQLGFYVEKPRIPPGTEYRYQTPDFIQFNTPAMLDVLALVQRSVFVINPKDVLTMPKELENRTITLGTSTYHMGIGGLHSTESACYHMADEHYSLSDHDVASYYPAIILRLGLFPQQMGKGFLAVYRAIVDKRLAAKRAGNKVTADSLKIVVNGSFGKFGSKYSILYAPDLMLQTTVTGQLALLMLIEALEQCGISVVSANTDGIVIKCLRCMEWLRDQVIRDWERRTSFETEANEYRALFSRDVNNYLALKTKGGAKTKGVYADAGLAKNPTNAICVDAVVAYLTDGVPIEQTIRACADIRRFVTIRAVQGGGEKLYGNEVAPATTIKGKREQLAAAGWEPDFDPSKYTYANSASLPFDEAHTHAVGQLRAAAPVRREYLGKAVRWYYAVGEPGSIRYLSNGNTVARSEGAKPLMELPDTMPSDVDHEWYIEEARDHLRNMGVAP